MDNNVILLQHWRDMVGYPLGPLYFRITGALSPATTPPFDLDVKDMSSGRSLAIARLTSPVVDVTLPLDGTAERVHIDVPSTNGQWSVLKSRSAYLIASPAVSYVYSDDIEKTYSYGLKRSFVTRSDRRGTHQPTTAGHFVLEIPMVGSRYLIARQDGQVIPHWFDLNNRLNVRVTDLSKPVDVSYEIPGWIWAITFAGFAIIGVLGFRPWPTKRA